jgi:hypothetical protein
LFTVNEILLELETTVALDEDPFIEELKGVVVDEVATEDPPAAKVAVTTWVAPLPITPTLSTA